ncbi:LpxI family protein [Enterovirga rhinocerotis]|uniref:Phosphatidate cytidylyltransferase n=1 Tax=Enterovirga rhinocerotis TaxID=1339210 RepID=A0A4R7C5D8_9HYPH|nr:UDP-2,3-diacylglucosamine diphosphatase LpxI [Enterovirga rhinocerotis]TDR93588.1 hypothetical protein EV668_0853 [Enterovirga rhinocerotis]
MSESRSGVPLGPIAILAGSGELPVRLADRLVETGRTVRILAFRGFCERRVKARADAVVNLLDLSRIIALLETWRPAAVTLAGGLTRPSAAALMGAYSAYRDREHVAAVIARGDDNLLRGAVELLESRGFALAGVRDLAPELLAEGGLYGAVVPDPAARLSIERGFRMLEALSPYDVGQAAVVSGERVVAIEGPEGTDRMLARVRSLTRGGLLRRRKSRGGVLVKGPKAGQDLRVDLPAIGPRTIVNASRAGLDGIAIAQGLTLVLDREATVAAADRAGLFLVGVERAGLTDAADD